MKRHVARLEALEAWRPEKTAEERIANQGHAENIARLTELLADIRPEDYPTEEAERLRRTVRTLVTDGVISPAVAEAWL